MGGPGGERNPEEPFAAGYGARFHGAVRNVAADKKIAIGRSTVGAHAGLGPKDNSSRCPHITILLGPWICVPAELRCNNSLYDKLQTFYFAR